MTTDIKIDENIFEQDITINCDDNDFIAFSLFNVREIDGIKTGKWTNSDWLKLNNFIFTEDVKYMKCIMIYLKYKDKCYRYDFQNIKSNHYLLTIENGIHHPVIKINNQNTRTREGLYRYSPYIFFCGCCSIINALDDIENARDNANRGCIIS